MFVSIGQINGTAKFLLIFEAVRSIIIMPIGQMQVARFKHRIGL